MKERSDEQDIEENSSFVEVPDILTEMVCEITIIAILGIIRIGPSRFLVVVTKTDEIVIDNDKVVH